MKSPAGANTSRGALSTTSVPAGFTNISVRGPAVIASVRSSPTFHDTGGSPQASGAGMDGNTRLSVVISNLRRRTKDERTTMAGIRRWSFVLRHATSRWLARDQLDLDPRPARQRGHRHRCARGVGRLELARIERVHRLEIADVGQEDVALDRIAEAHAGGRQHTRQSLEDLLGLGRNITLDELASGWIDPSLAGEKHMIARSDTSRVGQRRRRRVWDNNRIARHWSTPSAT